MNTTRTFCPPRSRQVEEILAQTELKDLFRQKLAEFRQDLNDKELDILDLRLLAEKPLTLQEIGARHQISRERVRQIEDRLIKRLRHFLKSEIPDWEDYRTPYGRLGWGPVLLTGYLYWTGKRTMPINSHRLNPTYQALRGPRPSSFGAFFLWLALSPTGCASIARLLLPGGPPRRRRLESPLRAWLITIILKAQRCWLADDAARGGPGI